MSERIQYKPVPAPNCRPSRLRQFIVGFRRGPLDNPDHSLWGRIQGYVVLIALIGAASIFVGGLLGIALT